MAKRLGRQTPTASVVLPYKSSVGKQAVKLYDQSTKRKALTWQKKLLRDIMARRADGLWVHTTFGFSVPRRNGKNEVIVMRELWGLINGERMCHTAHRTSTSHSAWERLYRVLGECGYRELGRKKRDEPDEDGCFRVSRQYGLETITMIGGGVIQFRTRTEAGGLGEGYDLLVIDEAQEYTANQQSTLIYTVSDSKNPQILMCGTPNTAVSAGTVFSELRDRLLAGNGFDAGWAEWGVDEEPEDIEDKSLWYRTNPSLGTILTERKIKAEIGTDRLDFIIQRLGYWYKYSLKSAITADQWDSLRLDELPELTGGLTVGIKFGKQKPTVAMSIAVRTWDGKILVECLGCRPITDGTSWILDFLRRADIDTVVIDGATSGELIDEMKQMRLQKPVTPTVAEYITANANFERALIDRQIVHMGQPGLKQSVTNCEKRSIGSSGGFGYKSIGDPVDVGPLDSIVLASWRCGKAKVRKKQTAKY